MLKKEKKEKIKLNYFYLIIYKRGKTCLGPFQTKLGFSQTCPIGGGYLEKPHCHPYSLLKVMPNEIRKRCTYFLFLFILFKNLAYLTIHDTENFRGTFTNTLHSIIIITSFCMLVISFSQLPKSLCLIHL